MRNKPPRFYIIGRSEDGTQYYEGHSCWGFDRSEARRFYTRAYAEAVCRGINAQLTPGWLFNVQVRESIDA